jgi:hypothetical protein
VKVVSMFGKVMGGAVLAFAAVSASAAPYVYNFVNEFSGSGGTCVNTSCATLSVEQNLSGGVDFILTSDLVGGEFITGLYGNLDPFSSSFPGISNGSITGGATATLSWGPEDAYKADGDGYFDWVWEFSNAAAVRFDNSDVLKWTFDNVDVDHIVDAISQNGPVGKTGFTFVVRAQGLRTGSGSGWFNSTGDPAGGTNTVPEPGTVWLVGLALVGLAAARRRTWKR